MPMNFDAPIGWMIIIFTIKVAKPKWTISEIVHQKDINIGKVPPLTTRLYNNVLQPSWRVLLKGQWCAQV